MPKPMPKPIDPIKRSRLLTRLLILSAILFVLTLVCILPPHFARESSRASGSPAIPSVTQTEA